MSRELVEKLELEALILRENLIKLATREIIHLGGDFSSAEILASLWHYKLNYDITNPKWELRDRLILSKGHVNEANDLAMASIGCFSAEDVINGYALDESPYSMHPDRMLNPFTEISSGSLGLGLPIATGMAAGLRIKGNNSSRVFVLMGDGEQAEGSIWEAAMTSVMHKLGNLVAILDYNKIEGDGFVSDFSGLFDIVQKYRSFGWEVFEIDGHDIRSIVETFDKLPDPKSEKPILIACHTIKGKGISYMENSAKWHTGKLSEKEAMDAIKVLKNEYKKRWDRA